MYFCILGTGAHVCFHFTGTWQPAGHILAQVRVWKQGKSNISNWLLVYRKMVGTTYKLAPAGKVLLVGSSVIGL